MQLFKAMTGDASLMYLIRAESAAEAVELANEKYDDDDFTFGTDDLEEVRTDGEKGVIEEFVM